MKVAGQRMSPNVELAFPDILVTPSPSYDPRIGAIQNWNPYETDGYYLPPLNQVSPGWDQRSDWRVLQSMGVPYPDPNTSYHMKSKGSSHPKR